MNANKLMIGDWVKFPGGAIDKIVDLPYIEGKGICASLAASATLFPFPISKIEPVSITPEILEKNGFRKLVTYGTEKWVCDNLRLNVYDSGETWRFCADTNRNENSVIYVRFIHELQHAIRLCGIEKGIIIEKED